MHSRFSLPVKNAPGQGVGLTRIRGGKQYPAPALSALQAPIHEEPIPSPPAARLWLYRALAAVAVPALLFLGLEVALRIAGFGTPVTFLIPDEKPGYFRTNPEFVSSFMPSSFDLRPLNYRVSARKAPGTLRVVVLGESAVQGVPAPPFGFAAQLRSQLRARYPGRAIEVINTGIVAINSHVVYQIARQLAGFSPDLFVVYMGNNEVVGPYGPGCTYLSEMPPLWVIRLSVFVRSTRIGQLVNRVAGSLTRRSHPPAEWGGMSMFVDNAVRGDDPRLEEVYRNFEANLRDIVRVASGAGAKTILCTVVSNLKDCAPLLSVHRQGLGEAQLEAWTHAFNRGRIEWLLGESASARADLMEALRIDPQYADTSFMLGRLDLDEGDIASSRRRFIDAQHWDALRFRPDPRINGLIRRVAAQAEEGATLLDAAMDMGSDPLSSAPPAGRELLFEHVHFDWDGNYRLSRSLAELAERVLAVPAGARPPWLDSAGCSDSLAYTPHERYSVLEHIGSIIQNPPFTNQLTYCDDEARLARDFAAAKAQRDDPQQLRHAKAVVDAAVAADPENADLAKIAEDIDDNLGDTAGALEEARRAKRLQPSNFALSTDEAIKLMRLGRLAEAETLLRDTARTCAPRDLSLMAPAFGDLFTRTRRFDEGRRYLDDEIARFPNDTSLKMVRGRLASFARDYAASEREYRAILAGEPGNRDALEALLGVLDAEGQAAAIDREALAAADVQPRNYSNDLRAAILCDAKGDETREIACLVAAEHCGPVSSSVEIKLARKLFRLGKTEEGFIHLAQARRTSVFEGDPSVTERIDGVIGKLRPDLR